jgi:hypothetical protein
MTDPTSSSEVKEERHAHHTQLDDGAPVGNVKAANSESSETLQHVLSMLSHLQQQSQFNERIMTMLMERQTQSALAPSVLPSVAPQLGLTTPTARRSLPPIPEVPRSAGLTPRSLFHSARSFPGPPFSPVVPSVPHVPSVPAVPSVSTSAMSEPFHGTSGTAPPPALPLHIIRRRVEAPNKFKGTSSETTGARVWLEAARIYLELSAENETDWYYVNAFALLLDGSALNWFINLRRQMGEQLTLEALFAQFVIKYVSVFNSETADLRLCSLMYLEGKCKDLNATEVEFDSLASEMCQGAEHYDGATNLLLASRYQEVIRKGDPDLWAKAAQMAPRPRTLDEWKEAVKSALAIRQMTSSASRQHAARNNPPQRNSFSSSSSSSSSPSSRPVTAVVQNVQARAGDADEKGETWERQEGEEQPSGQPEQLQQVKARPGPNDKPRYGSHLTHDQRVRLGQAKKCWICYTVGHMAAQCPDKNKAGVPRKPTDADLNL